MTEKQKQLMECKFILLTKKDVSEQTGWCESVVNYIFAYDKEFPAQKQGKTHFVELEAFKDYLKKRHNSKEG